MARLSYKCATNLPCHWCGMPTRKRIRATREPRCAECGIKFALDIVTSIKAKRGEGFDRWLAGIARYAMTDLSTEDIAWLAEAAERQKSMASV